MFEFSYNSDLKKFFINNFASLIFPFWLGSVTKFSGPSFFALLSLLSFAYVAHWSGSRRKKGHSSWPSPSSWPSTSSWPFTSSWPSVFVTFYRCHDFSWPSSQSFSSLFVIVQFIIVIFVRDRLVYSCHHSWLPSS